ncbi:MAG: hypothetical protein AB4050_15070 [Synechococcus sp.]
MQVFPPAERMDKLAIAVFGGAELLPGTRSANQQFRQYLRATQAPHWEIIWEPTAAGVAHLDYPCVAIGFSYGAVRVAALQTPNIIGKILIDGWCVWCSDRIPVFRLSHDKSTHLNALAFGGGQKLFCAHPAVDHLQLWRSPQDVVGWVEGDRHTQRSAAAFLQTCITSIAATHTVSHNIFHFS